MPVIKTEIEIGNNKYRYPKQKSKSVKIFSVSSPCHCNNIITMQDLKPILDRYQFRIPVQTVKNQNR